MKQYGNSTCGSNTARRTAACVAAALLMLAHPAPAQQTLDSAVQLRVGETRQIAVFGGHRPDCVTSTAPDAIEVIQAPTLGSLTQRQGVPYVLRNSLSNTCLGAHLLGTAMDYTANRPGTELTVLEAVFRNGRARRNIRITVTP